MKEPMPASSAAIAFRPVAAETGGELRLAMQSLFLAGRILPVGARLTVRHVFQSEEKKPLEVIYSLALPRDAALRRFQVSGPGFSMRSELKPVAEAVKAYEAGLEKGNLATLARQYGDGIVNLTLGNLRPGETVTVTLQLLAGVEMRDDGLRFRFPFTLAPSYHVRAKSARMPDGMGEMELPEDEFGDVILPRFAQDASGLHQVGFDLSVWVPEQIQELSSPSHPVRVLREDGHHGRVCLAAERDVPDRDLMLDVRAKAGFSRALAGLGSDGKGYFAATLASTAFGSLPNMARRTVLVLDRSGSMGGLPIAQARKAMEACLAALAEDDLFGIVAFDNHVERFQDKLLPATQDNRDRAREFLRGIGARGGTELASAVLAAAEMLEREAGDILVVTDGQVFGTEKILAQVRSAAVRIHCLGIGSASQDRFLALLARETGGVSRFVTPRERVDVPAVDLFASIGRPVATEIAAQVDGFATAAIAPEPAAAVFAGSPLVVFGETGAGGEGRLHLNWQTAEGAREMAVPLAVTRNSLGETLRLIRGARLLTDLESRLDKIETPGAAGKREENRVGDRLEALSQALGLASRRMALVAVVERAGDQPGEIPQTRIVPVGMPQDTAMGAYFLPRATALARMALGAPTYAGAAGMSPPASAARRMDEGARHLFSTIMGKRRPAADYEAAAMPSAVPSGPEDLLLDLAGRMQADGGMPGRQEEERIWATLVALLCFIAEGHTASSGAFRSHVGRLIAFLDSRASDPQLREALARIRKGGSLPGDWAELADPLRMGKSLDTNRARQAISQALA
jgi:Ca-activated chloride channel family protein